MGSSWFHPAEDLGLAPGLLAHMPNHPLHDELTRAADVRGSGIRLGTQHGPFGIITPSRRDQAHGDAHRGRG